MKFGIKSNKYSNLALMLLGSSFGLGATSNVDTWWADGIYALSLLTLIMCVLGIVSDGITDAQNEKKDDQ